MTSWEYFSWKKVSYLNGYEYSKGTPFDQGKVKNCFLFWSSSNEFIKWKIVKEKNIKD